MPIWGRLANPGLEDRHLKAVYFFAGNWKHGDDKFWAKEWYEYPTARNDQTYTVWPKDLRHLTWSESEAVEDLPSARWRVRAPMSS